MTTQRQLYTHTLFLGSHLSEEAKQRIENDIEVVEAHHADFPDEAGKKIKAGQLEIILGKPVAKGGMAVVHEAEANFTCGTEECDDDVPARCAAKRSFFPENQPEYEAALNKEAKLNFRIQHPNVVKPIYFGHHDDGYVLLMPFIDTDLQQVIDGHGRVTMPDKIAAYIIYMVVRTLQDLYDNQGIVHRDISPNNVLIDPKKGFIYLADFGVAKEKGQKQVIAAGKPPFMPPEAFITPELVDHRSDFYALGVLARIMKTGLGRNDLIKIPDSAKNNYLLFETMEMAKTPARPLTEIIDDVDLRFSDIVQRLDDPNPAERYGTHEELIDDLEAYLHEGQGPTPKSLAAYISLLNMTETEINEMDQDRLMRRLAKLSFLPRGPVYEQPTRWQRFLDWTGIRKIEEKEGLPIPFRPIRFKTPAKRVYLRGHNPFMTKFRGPESQRITYTP